MTIKALYPSISPSLMLDFANTEALDPRITFVRTTTATYYNGVTTAKAEENLFQQSQTFGNAYWTKNNVTITDDSTTAPDGTTTAELMYPTTTGTFRQLRRSDATGQTVSVFAKASGLNFLNIGVVATSANYTWFNLSTGVVGTTSALVSSATITDAGNGWYRCAVVFTSAQTDLRIGVADSDGNTTATNNGTDGIFLWGAQLEQRSAVTAYTPTTTQPITNYIPVLLTAASGVARFDHNPTTGESLGLLVEEQRTNSFTYSDDFADASWTKTRSSITSNTIVAPDGTLTGDKLVENTDNNSHRVTQSVAYVSGTTYTVSLYAKAAERTSFGFRFFNTAFGSSASQFFDLSNGTLLNTVSGVTASITPVGNGWYRCTASRAATTTSTSGSIVIDLSIGTTFEYTGDGYSGIYIWGAQLEAGAFPTSYIPTVAATVTRNADAASMTGANFTSWFNNAEGTLYSEGAVTVAAAYSGRLFSITDNSDTNRIEVFRQSDTQPVFAVQASGSSQALIGLGATWTTTASTKLVGAYKVNDFAASANAGTVGTDTSGVLPTVTQANIGSRPTGNYLNGTIRKLAYYPTRCTNAQLQALTS